VELNFVREIEQEIYYKELQEPIGKHTAEVYKSVAMSLSN